METSGVPAPACRICQGEEAPIIRPCRCEGTMAHAHPYCLAEWIAARGRLSCEVCSTPYSFELAVRDPPTPRSLRGLARLCTLGLRTVGRRLRGGLGIACEIVAVLLILTTSAAAIWCACWRCLTRRSPSAFPRPFPFLALSLVGFVLNVVPLAILLLYERFSVWAFVHEDDVAGLPPLPPPPPPDETPVDEAVAAARNAAFTLANLRRETHTGGEGNVRYVAAAHSDAGGGSILQLLQRKVRKAQRPGRRQRIWENTTVLYVAKLILTHLMLAGAIVLGDVTLQSLVSCCNMLVSVGSKTAVGSNSVAFVFLREALAEASRSSLTYWCSAFLLGLVTLLVPLRMAAAHLASAHAHLSRSLLLHCIFGRGAVAVVAVVLVWIVAVPVVVYVCLFPFFVESDATVLMLPQEAWQMFRSERLLPFTCGTASTTHPTQRRLSQPLNVARALILAAPDVWRGQCPPLFDPVSCGLDAGTLPPPQLLHQVAHYASFCGCALLRVCALPSWMTLTGTFRATFLWLLSGAFSVLLPYTTLGRTGDEQQEFFYTFLHLRGRVFWRLLCEVPAVVALYALTVGFPVFTILFRFSPEYFPRSLSYLSFFSFANRFSDFDFVYTWYRVIGRAHTAVLSVLRRLFLARDASPPAAVAEEGIAPQGGHVVEHVAYGVCLLLANIVIGATVEWLSWSPWFPFLGLLLNMGSISWLAVTLGGGLHIIRRRLVELRIRVTMLYFYGVGVTFEARDVCTCEKLTRLRHNVLTESLVRHTVQQQDLRAMLHLVALLDREHRDQLRCPVDVLQYITSYTLSYLATYSRLVLAAAVTAIFPLALCSAWHLDFATRASTDYVALPWWFTLSVRWLTGAVAGAVWVYVESRLLRTDLAARCFLHAPEIILGSLSREVMHAVVIPSVIHCGGVRIGISVVEHLFFWYVASADSPLLPMVMTIALPTLFFSWPRIRNDAEQLWRLITAARALLRPPPVAHPAPPPPPPPAPVGHPEPPQHGVGEVAPAAPVEVPPAEEERVGDGDGLPFYAAAEDARPPPEEALPRPPTPPPLRPPPPQQRQQQQQPVAPQQPRFLTRLQERISQWAASECATDVVLVDYAHATSGHVASVRLSL